MNTFANILFGVQTAIVEVRFFTEEKNALSGKKEQAVFV